MGLDFDLQEALLFVTPPPDNSIRLERDWGERPTVLDFLEKFELHCLDLSRVFDKSAIIMSKKFKKKVIYQIE